MNSKVKKGLVAILSLAIFASSLNLIGFNSKASAITNTASGTVLRGDMNVLDANGSEFNPNYSIAIYKDGSAWEWGCNRFPTKDSNSIDAPGIIKPVKKLDKVKVVSVGLNYTLAVKTDGNLWSWGTNNYGQLGTGTTTQSQKPAKIMNNVVTVSAGGYHAVALKKDGTLWGWGLSEMGQLGRENRKNEYYIKTPIKILDNVAAVATGAYHTMVIKKDGSLWGTGGGPNLTNGGGVSIRNGEFGTGMKFVKVMDDVIAVSCGTISTAIIKKDGTLWTWGEGKPEKMLDNAIAVSVGDSHKLAIKKDGTLWAWGNNYSGQIGDGTQNGYIEKPKKIMDKVVYTCAGGYDSFAIKEDGSIWAWGANEKGQLGNGTTKESTKPLKIGIKVTKPLQSANLIIKDYKFSPAKVEVKKDEKVNANTLNDNIAIERLKSYPKTDDSKYTSLQPINDEIDFGAYAKQEPNKIERAYRVTKEYLLENKAKYELKDTEFYTNVELAYLTKRGITILRGIIDGVDQEIEYGRMPDGTMVICTFRVLK